MVAKQFCSCSLKQSTASNFEEETFLKVKEGNKLEKYSTYYLLLFITLANMF